MAKAGAARIRVLESAWATTEPIEEFLLPGESRAARHSGRRPNVEFENTNYLGKGNLFAPDGPTAGTSIRASI